LSMMQGIDESFDAVFFIGYHARAGVSYSIMDHTYTSRIMDVKINGRKMSEAGINGRLAGYFGVPVVLVSGDQNAVKCVREELNDPVGIQVKEAIGRNAAILYPMGRVKKIRLFAILSG